MADSPLVKRLQVKPGQRMVVINPPAGYLDVLGPLPPDVELAETPDGTFDFVQLFVRNVAELERDAPTAIGALKRDGLLWISYPKRSSKVPTDLTRDVGWAAIARAGLEGVAQVAIDDVWSALRFRPTELVRGGKKRWLAEAAG